MNEVAEEIHSRGLERARRIYVAYCEAVTVSTTAALGAAFQAAGDALHAEADAATEQRKRGHQSLTKDLRNAAGRLVGIAQDLMELSKLDAVEDLAEKIGASGDRQREGYTPATDPVTNDLYTALAIAAQPELDAMRAADRERIAAYLGGETDEIPDALTPAMVDVMEREAIEAGNEVGAPMIDSTFAERDDGIHLSRGGPVDQYDNPSTGDRDTVMLLPELTFADPEPLRSAQQWVPADAEPYTYADLMRPVDPARFPDHWSWSQLTTLEDCGVQYRGQRLEQMPQQPQWSLIGGHAFHKIAEAFDRGAWQAGGADLLPDIGDDLIKQRWHDALAAEIEQTFHDTGIEMGEHGENYRAANGGKEGYTWWLIEGERMIEIYIHNRRKLDQAGRAAGQLRRPLELLGATAPNPQTALAAPARVPVIEYAYKRKLDVPTGTLTIEGIIDRAYYCADGSILVTDLKSGRLPNQTGQLGEYAWTLLELLGSQPTPNEITIRGNFYDARKGLFTDPVNLLERHPREEYFYRYGAADAARRMGVFLPHRSTFCAGCSIRWACPVGSA